MLAGSIAAGACSGSQAAAKGQVMVVLQSDMAIPKDFNRVRVDITVRGRKVFQETYVADESGGITLPGTIAVVAGEETAPPVEVKVVGINRDGEAQTFSKAVTTMPRSRIATLRVPMQWLCTGKVLTIGEGADAEFESACNPEKGVETSCVAGDCVPVDVAEPDLPTYEAKEVFGGGEYPDDPSGTCFDVQGCFKPGVDLLPDLDPDSDTYCQAAITVPQDFTVNFAVKTPPGGAGVCDDEDEDAPCYVVLDQSETFGWTALDSGGAVGGEPEPPVDGGTGGRGGSSGSATGGAPPASGGKSSGGGGGPAGGSATAGTGGAGLPPADERYIMTGAWHGLAFTASSPGSTIMLEPPGADPGFPLCVSGVVAADDGQGSFASVGFNLNQDMAGGDAMFIFPSDLNGGVHADITDNQGGGTFYLGLSTSFTNPLQGYCTDVVPDSATLYDWNSFMQTCWTGEGSGFDPETTEVLSLNVVVRGQQTPTPFDFCLNGVMEEVPIGQRRVPGLSPQSVPGPPGVKPQQAGGGEAQGSVLVQFPTAVCDRLNEDPDLRLRGTAACDAKTEATPICGPWSSVQTPEVPNPDAMLPGGETGEGGAGGMSMVGESGAGGDTGSGGVIIPNTCPAPPAVETTDPIILTLEGQSPSFAIASVDGRVGYAFSVGYGQCARGDLEFFPGGADLTANALRFQSGTEGGCPIDPGVGDTQALVVAFNSSPFPDIGPDTPPPVPASMCGYDASAYTGIGLWLQSYENTDVKLTFLTPETLAYDGPLPGGLCSEQCMARDTTISGAPTWTYHEISFASLEVKPDNVLGFKLEPIAPSGSIFFQIDQVEFLGLDR
jgi:hypothetical protein